ncbi:DUF2461 domain-containing protein [Hymenobacter sp. NBH84]|uniref:DUF2461 domain-containing protein n=1 Tax=Hymenobacter sp. NBH84 TaxID=2596915 RepID=UPI00162A7046|nr:DUF2461 domain-containing protein [Hymenobacter sp. NBH84]QNE40258.1 DUF2461 domain-containing protein [Hymenobacter sp. NBH84]
MNRASILDFLRGLAANNNKPWMDEHRAEYHQARAVFKELVAEVLQGVQGFEPALQTLTAGETMYRINKNDRFQQGQDPYKRHMGAGLKAEGRHSRWAGYFLTLEPGNSWLGAGKWLPDTASLQRIRQEIHYSPDTFHALRQHPEFVRHFPDGLEGDRLQRPPKGYDKNDPDIEWLKMKSYLVSRPISDAELLQPDFVARAVESLHVAQPLVQFLNQAIGEE